MKLTLFHRANNTRYDHACDCATIPVLDDTDEPAGYIGAMWGEFSDIPDCLNSAVLEPESQNVDTVLSFWGLRRDPNPPRVEDPPAEDVVDQ